MAALGLCGLLLIPPSPAIRLPALLLLGAAYACIAAGLTLEQGLAPELEGRDVTVEGEVVSLPERVGRRLRFEFEPQRMVFQGREIPPPKRLRLNWYRQEAQVAPGERWRMVVRLKRPHGMLNPGGFDYEAWLFRHQIRATGYVRGGAERLAVPAKYSLDAIRFGIGNRLSEALAGHPERGIITALAIGERGDIGRHQWQVFTATGTNHLMAISGLHIGLVAGLAFLLGRRLWGLRPTAALKAPAPKAAAVGALAVASVYAALAGFAVPTQRALIMVSAVMIAFLAQRPAAPGRALALALGGILLVDPLAVLAPGFWLSFGAVAVILYGMSGRLAPRGLWWRWGRVQWLVGIGLAPLLLALFGTASVVAPLANVIAVPWVGLWVVPATLVGTLLTFISPEAAKQVLLLAADSVAVIWPFLEELSLFDGALLRSAPPSWTLLPAIGGVAWLLAPRGWPSPGLGFLLMLPLLLVRPAQPAIGEAWLTVLDVGQGLSAVVRTREHLLVYDTGPRFSSGFDTGDAVVAPFLRHFGLHQVDTLVASHGDNDHFGGTQSLLEQFAVHRILTSDPELFSERTAEHCRRGMHWNWDGVEFRLLHPDSHNARDNDASCVLRIETGNGSALLTGDIEVMGEAQLIANEPEKSDVDVVVVPHHGSTTSSSEPFVASSSPKLALFSTGYRNHYGFPAKIVTERYLRAGARLAETAQRGAITVHLGGSGPMEPEYYRERYRRYWHDG